jgi:hypothetical protein
VYNLAKNVRGKKFDFMPNNNYRTSMTLSGA